MEKKIEDNNEMDYWCNIYNRFTPEELSLKINIKEL